LKKKPKDANESFGLSSSSTIKEKNVENDKSKGSLLFSTTEKKKTKDDDELGS
jgi:hypothetical protein